MREPDAEPLRIALRGASGRLGRVVEEALAEVPDLEVTARPGRGEALGGILPGQADILLDLTAPDALADLDAAIGPGRWVVVGTSGVGEAELSRWRARLGNGAGAVLVVPNFALGAVLLQRFAAEAVRWLPAVEIVELHHAGKKDSPSGTAAETARRIAAARGDGRSAAGSAEGPFRGGRVHGIPIHSVRLPGLLAHQEVLFGGAGEVLSLRHDTLDRKAFVPGILLALRKVRDLVGLHVGLEACLPPAEGG